MALKNSLIGGIRNTFLRRLAMTFVGVPMMIIGLAPPYLRVFPGALANAWDEFAAMYRAPNALCALAFKETWSKSWTPVE
jgi:hypothetical protein